jgi:hypothetical protein
LVPPPATLSTRFNFNSTLAGIGETSREATYRPLAANYRPLWTSDARLPVSKDAADDSRGAESGDDQSVYTDALEEQPGETDADHSEDEYRRYHAHDLPRPSCDIFLNTDDDSVKSPVPASQPLPLVLPRGKANIPTGKIDWFDLPDDDLGELDWAVPAGTSAAGNDT